MDGKDSKEARSCYIYPVDNLRILEIAAIMVDPFGIVEEPSIAIVITLAAVIALVEEVMLKVEIRAVLKPNLNHNPYLVMVELVCQKTIFSVGNSITKGKP